MKDKYAYSLPDSRLFDIEDKELWEVWIPQEVCVVLGKSNNPSNSILIENVEADRVKVFRRPSGGEAVVLTPSTPVISIAKKKDRETLNCTPYFMEFSQMVIGALQPFCPVKLEVNGVSDITAGNMKISGSSIYQNRSHIFYHAVINVSEDTETFSKYLKHPPKEPDYRSNRKHEDFVISLQSLNSSITVKEVVEKISEYFSKTGKL